MLKNKKLQTEGNSLSIKSTQFEKTGSASKTFLLRNLKTKFYLRNYKFITVYLIFTFPSVFLVFIPHRAQKLSKILKTKRRKKFCIVIFSFRKDSCIL